MNATVHQFPGSGGEEQPRKPVFSRPPNPLESFTPEQSVDLLEVARHSLSGAEALLDFVHENRELARHSGIETIAVELLAIMQGDRFSRVIDALDESAKEGIPVELTAEGLATLRRVESLLAESSANIRKFTEGDFTVMEIVENRARAEAEYQQAYLDLEEKRMDGIRRELQAKKTAARRQAEKMNTLRGALGQTNSSSSSSYTPRSSELSLWIPFAIFGVVAVTITVVAVVAGKK